MRQAQQPPTEITCADACNVPDKLPAGDVLDTLPQHDASHAVAPVHQQNYCVNAIGCPSKHMPANAASPHDCMAANASLAHGGAGLFICTSIQYSANLTEMQWSISKSPQMVVMSI